MTTQSLGTLGALKAKVQMMIPDTATNDDVWTYLNWDASCSQHYEIAKTYGIDLRPIVAPVFDEVVSLLCDGIYIQKGLRWEEVLSGQVLKFKGGTAKARIISVIEYCIRQNLHS